ncbi:MAG: peptidoglycan-binding protein [Nitrospirae bacterium]|nr:peptidoglycan-binding protein [Nitrospirota bacterium]
MATTHAVKQGECLASIAKKYGFADWQKIYDHPQNGAFKSKRPNPNVLYPGDEVFIPDKKEKKESCRIGQKHRFKVKSPKTLLQIILKDDQEQALAYAAYTLRVARQARPYTGSTDGAGLLKLEIPIGVKSAELSLDELGLTWNLEIDHLDPVEELVEDKAIITGVQARLNNLGFHCGKVDGMLGPKTKEAIKKFQEIVLKRGSPNGEPDDATLNELVKQHGC